MQNCAKFKQIDAVNQGHWSLSIQWRLECFVIVEKYKQFDKAPTYSQNDSKIEGCLRCQLVSWKRARKWLSIFNLTFIYTHFSESNLVLKLCRRPWSPVPMAKDELGKIPCPWIAGNHILYPRNSIRIRGNSSHRSNLQNSEDKMDSAEKPSSPKLGRDAHSQRNDPWSDALLVGCMKIITLSNSAWKHFIAKVEKCGKKMAVIKKSSC